MKKVIIPMIYTFLIILVFGLVVNAVSSLNVPQPESESELASYDLSRDCVLVTSRLAQVYNNMLLTPDEARELEPNGDTVEFEHYATFRFTVRVKEGAVYGIAVNNPDYAVKIYVDGVLLKSVGTVADNKEDFVPTAAACEVFFAGKGDTAEIVVQQANFNHYKNYGLKFRLGAAEKVSLAFREYLLSNMTIAVVLLTAFLMNLGALLCFRDRKDLFWFTLLCLFAAVCEAVPKVTSYFIPNLNWYLSHKLETGSMTLLMLSLVMYMATRFKEYTEKTAKWIAIGVSIAVAALFWLTPSTVYSRCNELAIIAFAVSFLPMIILMTIRIFKNWKTISESERLSFWGFLLVIVFTVLYVLIYFGVSIHSMMQTMTGISLFVFFNTIALAMDFSEARLQLEQAEVRKRELVRANELLTGIDGIRESFLADLSHELKTPLTVIATNAYYASRQVSLGVADEATADRLGSVEREAVRLGELVERLRKSATEQYSEKYEELDMRFILNAAADFCNPLCARNGNTLTSNCGENIKAYSSRNVLFHCLYNLISNSTRHCRDSAIEMLCERNGDGWLTVSVRDHGDGMTDEAMEHAFDRGFSGDSSTGIGLPLCRELVEKSGGSMWLEHTPGGGLTARLTVKEAEEHAEDSAD